MKASLNLKVAIGLIVFCLFNYFYLIPVEVIAEGAPPTYPYLVNSLLLLFSLGFLVESFAGMRAEKAEEEPGRREQAEAEARRGMSDQQSTVRKAIRVGILFALMAGWYWTLEAGGFLLTAIIFLALSSPLYGARSPFKIGVLALLMPFIVHFLFRSLGTALPEGPLEELITTIIYG